MLITNFSSGELSPELSGRVDLESYYSGASKIQNWTIIPTGGVKRRVGFEKLLELSGRCRLIPFILDKDNSFIFALTPGTTYIYKDGKPYAAQESFSNEYENFEQIDEIQYAQNYDTLIFVQRDHAPLEIVYSWLLRTFTASAMLFSFYPDVKLDDDYNYIKVAGTEGLPEPDFDGQLCIYNGQLWIHNEGAVQEWEVYGTDPEIDTGLFTTEGKYPGCVAFYNSRLFFASSDKGRQKIWASSAPDTKGTRYNNFSTWQKYVTVSKAVKDADVHIFTASILTKNIDKSNGTTILTNVTHDFTKNGALKKSAASYYCINSTYVSSGTKVLEITKDTIKIDEALNIDEDKNAIVFQLSLWQDTEAATADDYEYVVSNTNVTTSDCSFNFELASDQNDAIKWLGTSRYLSAGTESSVWYIPSSVTAINIQSEMNGRYGSDGIQAHAVGSALIYLAQGNKGIREYYYDSSEEAFRTNNIALSAGHLLKESAVKEFDFITNPYNRILLTREDGTIAEMLYDKTNNIMAWSRTVHGSGQIKSTAIVRGSDDSDIIYCAVLEGDTWTLQRLDPNIPVYLDSFYEWDHEGTIPQNMTLFNASKNEEWSDSVNLEDWKDDTVYVGAVYESVLSSMPVSTQDPTTKKRITGLLVRFLESYMPVLQMKGMNDELFSPESLPYTGVIQITFPGNYDRDVIWTLKQEDARPSCILSINAETA